MASGTTQIEQAIGRRRAPRTECSLMVEVRVHANEWGPALLADMSKTGFKLRGLRELGDFRSLWLRPPGMPPLPAKIRWSSDASVGCEFLYPLDQPTEKALRQLLACEETRERMEAFA